MDNPVSYICYVNGEYVPASEARVSAFDHGFLYGDGLFESMTVVGRRIFRFQDHLGRMERSARALKLTLPRRASGSPRSSRSASGAPAWTTCISASSSRAARVIPCWTRE